MKLHLPLKLRAALAACLSAVSPFVPTVASGSLAVGAAVFALAAAPAASADTLASDVILNDGSSVSGTVADADGTTEYGLLTSSSGAISTDGFAITVNHGSGSLDEWAGLRVANGTNGEAFVFTGTALSGDGNLALVFVSGSGGYTTYATLDFSEDSDFTGRILLIDAWNNSLTASYSGTALENAEIVFAQNSVDLDTDPTNYTIGGTTIAAGNNRYAYELELTGDASLSGVSAELPLTTTGQTPAITTTGAGDYTLTLTGGCTTNQTYVFAGNLGSESAWFNLLLTGGSQTFSGTNYVGSVTVTGGSLVLGSGTVIAGDVSVSDGTLALTDPVFSGGSVTISGGTISITGELRLSEAIGCSGGAVDLSGVTVLDVSGLTAEESGSGVYTYTLVSLSGSGTLTGLEMESLEITGINPNGKEWSFDSAAGTLSYTMIVGELTYSGGELTWEEGGSGFDDGGVFASGDIVTFQTADADVTLGSNVASTEVTIEEGVSVTLTGNGYELEADALIIDGRLVLTDGALSESTAATTETGAGVVEIDAGTGSVDLTQQLAGFAGDVEVTSGRLELTGSTEAASST